MNLKQFVWQELDKNGYVLDQDIFRFAKKDNCLCAAATYKSAWHSFNHLKDTFKKRIENEKWEVSKVNRQYWLEFKSCCFMINKDYADYLKSLKDN